MAALAARLMIASTGGRSLMGDLLGVDASTLALLDERLRRWLESSHLEEDQGGGLN